LSFNGPKPIFNMAFSGAALIYASRCVAYAADNSMFFSIATEYSFAAASYNPLTVVALKVNENVTL